jgi:hypothetical protein
LIGLVLVAVLAMVGIGLFILKKIFDSKQYKRYAASVGEQLGIVFSTKKTLDGYLQASGSYQGHGVTLLTGISRVSHNIIRVRLDRVTPISFMMASKVGALLGALNRSAHGEVTFGDPAFDERYTVNSHCPPERLAAFFTPELRQLLLGPDSPLGDRTLSVTDGTIESSGFTAYEDPRRAATVLAFLVDLAGRLPRD